MPAIKVTATKGLHQVAGTTSVPSGTISGHKKVAVSSSAALTLTAADSGKVIFIDGGSGHAYTLPTGSNLKGLHYKFIMTDTTADCTITAGSAIIKGTVSATGGTAITPNATTITMELAGSVGDWVELVSDGTNWYVCGHTGHAAGIS